MFAQVYAQVQILFKDNPDLLHEFKDFLPAASGGMARAVGGAANSPAGDAAFSDSPAEKRGKADTSTQSTSKRKKRAAEKDLPMLPSTSSGNAKAGANRVSYVAFHALYEKLTYCFEE